MVVTDDTQWTTDDRRWMTDGRLWHKLPIVELKTIKKAIFFASCGGNLLILSWKQVYFQGFQEGKVPNFSPKRGQNNLCQNTIHE